jgi:TRAP transporter 4TM/12TM fusion protein
MQRTLIVTLAAVAVALHLYSAGIAPLTALVLRPLHLALLGALGFLGATLGTRRLGEEPASRTSLALAVLLGSACVYLVSQHQALVMRAGTPRTADIIAGAVAIVLVLELARRAVSAALVVVALLALVYSQAGPWLPGLLGHRGYSPTRVVEHLFLGTEGIWGVPLGVSADFVFLFILFGTLLDASGGGQLLLALAQRAAGNSLGGPAKTAAVASAFMGSLSGSAVANVVTTGTLTIPMMKRAGFKPHVAAAIEAAASTGGQLVPPVMGAGAFILATWTAIPYLQVATSAVLPALLYYVALLAGIHFTASRAGIATTAVAAPADVGRRLHLLVPLIGIVVLLAFGRSPMRAAFWGVVLAFTSAMLSVTTRPDWARLRGILIATASGAVPVAAACAAAGIIVGVATLTGIGLRMSGLIITLSGGYLLLGLFWTALAGVILGMGLPTTAAYVVLAALGAPALVELGAPPLAAHLFIFYFGCISNVTPPVSLAAYAAAGIAEAPALRTAITALLLAATGFVIPFAFVFAPALLLQGSFPAIVFAAGAALAGVVALAAAAAGHHNRPLPAVERVALLAAAVAMLGPATVPRLIGATLLLVSISWGKLRSD